MVVETARARKERRQYAEGADGRDDIASATETIGERAVVTGSGTLGPITEADTFCLVHIGTTPRRPTSHSVVYAAEPLLRLPPRGLAPGRWPPPGGLSRCYLATRRPIPLLRRHPAAYPPATPSPPRSLSHRYAAMSRPISDLDAHPYACAPALVEPLLHVRAPERRASITPSSPAAASRPLAKQSACHERFCATGAELVSISLRGRPLPPTPAPEP
jgi:hypothetical protein